MVQISGLYQCENNENLEEYLKETGLPDEYIKRVTEVGATVEAFEDGDKFTFNSSSGSVTSFVLDQEYEELAMTGVKSLARREVDTFIITSTTPNGQIGVRSYEFTEDGITAVMIFNGVTAKRYYKRI